MVPIDLLKAGLPQISGLWKNAVSAQLSKRRSAHISKDHSPRTCSEDSGRNQTLPTSWHHFPVELSPPPSLVRLPQWECSCVNPRKAPLLRCRPADVCGGDGQSQGGSLAPHRRPLSFKDRRQQRVITGSLLCFPLNMYPHDRFFPVFNLVYLMGFHPSIEKWKTI